jgi:transcription elongation GreA/GreB family factor
VSRAFVSEAAEEARAALLPERPVSPHPNLVTPRGMALIEAEVAALRSALAAAPADDAARPRLARDLRYWQARRAGARVMEPPPAALREVAFGSLVVVRRAGAVSRFRIVGEDEADPAQSLLSWTSPLARALMGARVGDLVEVGNGRGAADVEAIEA